MELAAMLQRRARWAVFPAFCVSVRVKVGKTAQRARLYKSNFPGNV